MHMKHLEAIYVPDTAGMFHVPIEHPIIGLRCMSKICCRYEMTQPLQAFPGLASRFLRRLPGELVASPEGPANLGKYRLQSVTHEPPDHNSIIIMGQSICVRCY